MLSVIIVLVTVAVMSISIIRGVVNNANTIYGNSTTVPPLVYHVNIWIRTA